MDPVFGYHEIARLLHQDERIVQRFRAWVRTGPPESCWPWRGRLVSGYGRFRVGGRYYAVHHAHRVAWVIEHGRDVPDDLFVRHLCHNRACCNPKHLELGTHAENMADSARIGVFRGSRNGNAKLDEGKVRSILADRRSMSEIARSHGVSVMCIHGIKRGRTWAWVTVDA